MYSNLSTTQNIVSFLLNQSYTYNTAQPKYYQCTSGNSIASYSATIDTSTTVVIVQPFTLTIDIDLEIKEVIKEEVIIIIFKSIITNFFKNLYY
jgi:hypothetical protein